MWVSMIFVWSVCSTFFTPLEFGFFRGLPEHLQDLDCAQSVFLADVVLQFFAAYRDVHTSKLVRDRKSIALIGNMTALIVKGSKTERFRDKMTDLIKYMNRNKLGKEISSQIKNHLLLHYESSDTKYSVVEDIPVAIRSKVVISLIAKQEAELVLRVNNAAYHGDLYTLKGLINAGADPNKISYDGRTALHVATSRGYEEIVKFLVQRGANVNCIDKFGSTPLLEAVKAGHDRIAAHLVKNGAMLNLEDNGSYLRKIATESNISTLRRLLEYGVDPNTKNYDLRTPLHVAAAEGLHLVAAVLLEFGADVLSKDRWGNTPLDEGRRCGSKPLLQILEQARANLTCNK